MLIDDIRGQRRTGHGVEMDLVHSCVVLVINSYVFDFMVRSWREVDQGTVSFDVGKIPAWGSH
jgi:hypothetical protein